LITDQSSLKLIEQSAFYKTLSTYFLLGKEAPLSRTKVMLRTACRKTTLNSVLALPSAVLPAGGLFARVPLLYEKAHDRYMMAQERSIQSFSWPSAWPGPDLQHADQQIQ
jgi:hypothetical protein